MVRAEKVQELVAAAMDGMTPGAADSSADEVTSACLTIALRGLKAAKSMGAEMQGMRAAVERLLLECTDERSH